MEKPTKRKRPFGIIVITILQIILVIALVVDVTLQQIGVPSVLFGVVVLSEQLTAFEIVAIIFQAVVTIGFWGLKRWAWFLFMVQLGFSMAFDLWTYFNLDPIYVNMLRNVIMVFYLNQREVQQVFEHKRQVAEAT